MVELNVGYMTCKSSSNEPGIADVLRVRQETLA
jgi:hypothetical protein